VSPRSACATHAHKRTRRSPLRRWLHVARGGVACARQQQEEHVGGGAAGKPTRACVLFVCFRELPAHAIFEPVKTAARPFTFVNSNTMASSHGFATRVIHDGQVSAGPRLASAGTAADSANGAGAEMCAAGAGCRARPCCLHAVATGADVCRAPELWRNGWPARRVWQGVKREMGGSMRRAITRVSQQWVYFHPAATAAR
jgi:hypothetical protein